MDGDGQIDIPSNGNQEKTEEQVTQLSLGFQLLNPSSECMQVAKPFPNEGLKLYPQSS